jgi:hypothetical protein
MDKRHQKWQVVAVSSSLVYYGFNSSGTQTRKGFGKDWTAQINLTEPSLPREFSNLVVLAPLNCVL